MLLIVEEDHCDQKCVKCRPTSDDGRNGQPDYVRCSPVTVDNASQAVLVSLRITEYKNLIFISIYDTHAGVEKKSNEHSNPSDQITRPHLNTQFVMVMDPNSITQFILHQEPIPLQPVPLTLNQKLIQWSPIKEEEPELKNITYSPPLPIVFGLNTRVPFIATAAYLVCPFFGTSSVLRI